MASSSNLLMKLLQYHPERMGLALLSLAADKSSHPALDLPHYLERIAALAEDISRLLPPSPATGDILYAMNTRLFDELALHANPGSDKETPFLHLLLEERHGRPVTLAILYLTIGRLLHLPLECVSLSGRLLVRVADGDDATVIDPVAGGIVLTDSELQQLLVSKLGGSIGPTPRYHSFLQRLDDRALMVRMLRHHKALHLAQHHHEAALLLVEMILELIPENAAELLDRARLREILQQHEAAAADYLYYLEANPDSVMRDDLYQRMQLLLACPQTVH